MFRIPGTSFVLFSVLEALWYLPMWFQWVSDYECRKTRIKPKPERLPPPPEKTFNVDNADSKTSPAPQIFALIIAIDNYLNKNPGTERVDPLFPDLCGCKEDAKDIIDFLTVTLLVPVERITTLYDNAATVGNIIGAFKSLASDTRIPKGASIFIFYAGHGGEALKSDGSGEMIQTLIPYDFDPGSDLDRLATNGLADHEIGQLLEKIADKKGNNITVVFDCCHSGSGTRHFGSVDENIGAARSVKLPIGTRLASSTSLLPPTISRGSIIRDQHKNKTLASHVIFAACKESERAYEKDGRGAFTRALTKLLRSEDLHELTYSDIVTSLPALDRHAHHPFRVGTFISHAFVYSQHPQCEGKNQDRIFLHNKVAGPRRIVHHVTRNNKNGKYELDAGEAHGVTRGAEFAVYDTKACFKEVGRLRVSRVEAFKSTISPFPAGSLITIPEAGAFALQTLIGAVHDVRLFVELNNELVHVFAFLGQEMLRTSPHRPSFKVVSSLKDGPDLIITACKGTTRLGITDSVCRGAGLYEIPYHPTTDKQTMACVLRAAADFYCYLHRKPKEEGAITSEIDFECYELTGRRTMTTTGKNLCQDRVIQLSISDDDEKAYGFRLHNKSNASLFVSVFYFNMSDLSIASYYQPPSAADGSHSVSLPANRSLTIGYGSGGSEPKSFYLDEGQEVDVGYIKIFFSTQYVNYRTVPQASPFGPGAGSRGSRDYHREPTWETMRIPVIQKREVKPLTFPVPCPWDHYSCD